MLYLSGLHGIYVMNVLGIFSGIKNSSMQGECRFYADEQFEVNASKTSLLTATGLWDQFNPHCVKIEQAIQCCESTDN